VERCFAAAVGLVGAVAALTLGAGPATAQRDADAVAAMADQNGEPVGSVLFLRMPHGTLIEARLENLPLGEHGFHVHETGECTPPFTSAGGHYNPDGAAHGFATDEGFHAGDLPNIHIPASGRLEVAFFATNLAVDDRLLDANGAAVVVHEGTDDYSSQPSGAAGDRIACGVIRAD
jgi:Cu-Zn family superoxide dismutase